MKIKNSLAWIFKWKQAVWLTFGGFKSKRTYQELKAIPYFPGAKLRIRPDFH